MLVDYKKIELFGKSFLQKVILKAPFDFSFPVVEQACFLYMLDGDMQFQSGEEKIDIPTRYSLLLNCLESGKKVRDFNAPSGELVIVTFHSDILKKVYEREMPRLLQKTDSGLPDLSAEKISNDFLIHKYIEGLLFYFANPALVSEEILVLKLKEIILLLSQTRNARNIQLVLSQLFSPAVYTFRQIVEASIFSGNSVEELAQKTNLSVSSFKREFSKQFNDSPASYIRSRRLERAAELLLAGDSRISDIAYDCGFADLANFTRSFHERFEVTPSQYRLNQMTKGLD